MDIGYLFLIISFLSSLYATYAFYIGSKSDKKVAIRLLKRAENSLYIYTISIIVSILILTYYFLIRDFNVRYVYLYSDRHLSPLYTISAVWAGREGSLLLWAVYIAILNVLALKIERKDRVLALSLSISSFIFLFLSLLLLTTSNPFVRLEFTPQDGYGLIPLLRTPEMALHPPTIFLGYAGATLPFSIAIASMYLRSQWENRIRIWTLITWIFLSIGIFLGGWWAYKTLGWGGFWAWDPVENASLLPWLTATALIHGLIRRFRHLNFWLTSTTFMLVILATFITRSGIIESVHAFGESAEAYFYLALITFSALLSFKVYKGKTHTENKKSASTIRDLTLIMNIFILSLSAITILLGTLTPLFSDVVVGKSFYNRIEIPLGTLLVILLGICIAMDWKFNKEVFLLRIKISSLIGIIAGIIVFFVTSMSIASLASGIFLFSLINHIQTIKPTDYKNPRKFGGYITHIGLLLLFIGVMGSWIYEEHYKVEIPVGGSYKAGEYELKLKDVIFSEDEEKVVATAIVDVYKDGNLKAELNPKLINYKIKRQERIVSGVSIDSSVERDYYIAISGISQNKGFFEFYVIPLVSFVWIGSIVMIIGGLFAMSYRLKFD